METWTDDDGVAWVSCDCLCVGDYGGAGSVGEANIRILETELPDDQTLVKWGAYSSRQLWLLDTPDNREIVRGLEEDYPLFDEKEHSEVEMEWEREAWESYGHSDLQRTLPEGLRDASDDLLTDEEAWECYREAMEATNSYPEMEYSGASLPIDRIQGAYLGAVERAVAIKLGVGEDAPDEIRRDALKEAGILDME